jgi:tRNA G18 (ribose-2'-O)-methylase SpoU
MLEALVIRSTDDPNIADYLNVTHPKKREATPHFIAEGENVALRLLASDYRCRSVLCVDRKLDRLRPHVRKGTQLLTADESMLQRVVGFKFHSGVIAVGERRPTVGLDALAGATPPTPGRRVLVVLPEITDPANLGAIVRVAAAFGASGLLLGERCRDPFTRQSIRTSMGTIFSLPIGRSNDIRADLQRLRQPHSFECFATVLADDAEPLRDVRPTKEAVALLLGNEGPGLEPDVAALCDRRITIPMHRGTDSLNVAVSAGILLNHLQDA